VQSLPDEIAKLEAHIADLARTSEDEALKSLYDYMGILSSGAVLPSN
jgi:hypothetical protein